jgi:L-lysine exporter family protein LysE/ArgO
MISFTPHRLASSVESVLTLLAGFAFGLSLIVAIGPQNAFVLSQGARRRHVLLVVATCAASDVALIAIGVAGVGAALEGRAWLTDVLTIAGVAFLVGYGLLALRRALGSSDAALGADVAASGSWPRALGACLAFTWLNPGVYVDTVLLVAPVAHSHGGGRWTFGTGAMVASVVWFVALGYGGRLLGGALRRPGAWRALDVAVATVMALTAVRLVASA